MGDDTKIARAISALFALQEIVRPVRGVSPEAVEEAMGEPWYKSALATADAVLRSPAYATLQAAVRWVCAQHLASAIDQVTVVRARASSYGGAGPYRMRRSSEGVRLRLAQDVARLVAHRRELGLAPEYDQPDPEGTTEIERFTSRGSETHVVPGDLAPALGIYMDEDLFPIASAVASTLTTHAGADVTLDHVARAIENWRGTRLADGPVKGGLAVVAALTGKSVATIQRGRPTSEALERYACTLFEVDKRNSGEMWIAEQMALAALRRP